MNTVAILKMTLFCMDFMLVTIKVDELIMRTPICNWAFQSYYNLSLQKTFSPLVKVLLLVYS